MAPYMQHGSPGSPDYRRHTLPGGRLCHTQNLSAHLAQHNQEELKVAALQV